MKKSSLLKTFPLLIFLSSMLLSGPSLLAQVPNGQAYIPDPYFFGTKEKAALILSKADNFPSSMVLDFFGAPFNQGNTYACLPSATCHAIQIIEGGKTPFSPFFLFNKAREKASGCLEGTHFADVFNVATRYGIPERSEFDTRDCNLLPGQNIDLLAASHKIKSSQAVFKPGDSRDTKSENVEFMLSEGRPVIVGMEIDTATFAEITPNNPFWDAPDYRTSTKVFHAMVVIGYDRRKRQFTLLNSYGPSWGDNGRFDMSYEDFGTWVEEAYVITMKPVKGQEPPLGGGLTMRKLSGYDRARDEVKYDQISFSRKGIVYEPTAQELNKGSAFQLQVSSDMVGNNLYVFSIDPKLELNYHFPIQAEEDWKIGSPYGNATFGADNIKLEDLDVLSEVNSADVGYTIPDEETLMRLSHSGTDYLFVLLSRMPISDLPGKARAIQSKMRQGSDPVDALHQVLGRDLIPTSDINYNDRALKFSTNTTTGSIIPLVIKLSTP
ncbi:MAG: C1 family peptidase [Bacteroidota bacterium]